jgi:quinoprotein glucose dehydrogenase
MKIEMNKLAEKLIGRSIQKYCFLILFLFVLMCSCNSDRRNKYKIWEGYGGGKENIHYSALSQIDTNNVNDLEVAWVYHTGDADTVKGSQMQVNPVIVNNILYGVSPKLKLFSLDASTGKQRWIFDPSLDTNKLPGESTRKISFTNCRGITFYKGGKNDSRIFYTAGSLLYCINAFTGVPVTTFGSYGRIDLHNDLGRDVKDLYVACTTPGIIYKDLIIIGSTVAEEAAAAPGHIRAYDVFTGKLKWIFHTIPQPNEEGYSTWDDQRAYQHIGGANAWSGFSMDEQKGILFAPLGSATYDFYGGKRIGNNLYANCVLALNAATGKRIWYFQTVHHDLWDRDLPTAPVLVNLLKEGKHIEAIAQVTKTGFVFLLDRTTGNPVYPVNEIPVPTESELAGEHPWPTQPRPSFPKPFVRQLFTEKDLNHLVPDSSFQDIKKRWQNTNHDNLFNPPSKKGTIIFPGFDGGAEWGGPSFDPSTGILYVNASEMAWILTMVDVKNKKLITQEKNIDAGKRIYVTSCLGCHGIERQGSGNNPSLVNVNKKYTKTSFQELISSGRRMMPAFKQLSEGEKDALASFILENKAEQKQKFVPPVKAINPYLKMPYSATGYNKFLTKEGYPAVDTPWGTLNAINLNTGEFVWKVTLGDYPELKAKGIHSGTENYGGSVVTAGGLVFIAATKDSKFRAFNKRTGKLLWEKDLPASGFATPAVYEIKGIQYIVIACGGGKLKTKPGDAYVAFALRSKQ